MVTSEQGVQIAELKAQAVMKEAKGDAEATRLKALGEAEAIRTTGKARTKRIWWVWKRWGFKALRRYR